MWTRAKAAEAKVLWRDFHESRSTDARAKLVTLYMPLVRQLAFRIHGTLPGGVELDDLVSVGTVGLIKGIDNYDPSRGTAPATYLTTRIRGAVLDELRSLDMLPRYRRANIKLAEKSRAALLMELGRPPTPEEVAARAGGTVQPADADPEPAARPMFSLDVTFYEDGKLTTVSENMVQVSEPDPLLLAARTERHPTILDGLTDVERDVIERLFYRQESWGQVARAHGLSESRINQYRVRALDKIHGGRTYRQMRAMLVA